MSNERRAGAGGYRLLSEALAMAAEERDVLEADLREARTAIRNALDALAGDPGGASNVALAQRLLRATLPEGAP